jgi:hypothetical protein
VCDGGVRVDSEMMEEMCVAGEFALLGWGVLIYFEGEVGKIIVNTKKKERKKNKKKNTQLFHIILLQELFTNHRMYISLLFDI